MSKLRDLVRFEGLPRIEVPGWLDRLIAAGIVTADPQVARRQKITNVASYAGAFNSFSRVATSLLSDHAEVPLVPLVSGAFGITALLIHRLHRFGDHLAAHALVVWFLISVSFAAAMFGLHSQVQVYFALGGLTLFMFGVEHWRVAAAWFLTMAVVMVLVIHYTPPQGMALSAPVGGFNFIGVQTMINAMLINAALILYALVVLRRTEQDLERQSARAETLVGVVLPDGIAERLRSGQEFRIADRIEGLSVLFADLVSFTPAAHKARPEIVVAYLDDLVKAFDALCDAHGLDKIKTIGDSYMAVGGLHGDSRRCAAAIGWLALAMLDTQAARPPLAGRKLDLRIGIHYGTAIAGIIGETRITYDIWGDAVNVAARMESFGAPNRIHVTEDFVQATADVFDFEERGITDLKGIGPLRTYFLLGPRSVGLTAAK